MKIGFIGLGNMGMSMVRNLLRAGHELVVWNRTRSRAEALGKEGAKVADTPAAAASNAEVLVTMLADDVAVETVVFGQDGILNALPPDATHASMSTISPTLSRRLAEAHRAAGQKYIAAPVFGPAQAAEEGKLWIVAAGPAEAIAHCRPILSSLGQGIIEVSEDVAAANVVKLAGNFLFAAIIEALAEVFVLLRKHSLDPAQFLEFMNGNIIRSPTYERYGKRILDEGYEPPSFRLRHALKDLRLVLGAAEEVAAPMPLASLIHDHYLSALARGWGEIDWTALARVAAEEAGLGRGEP